MSAPISVPASGLEAIKDELRAVSKNFRSGKDGYFPYVASALEKYVRGHSAILITDLTAGHQFSDYQLLFHRVPPVKERATARHSHFPNMHPSDTRGNLKSNTVLVVYQAGHVTDKIVAAGKSWSSSVWLLPKDFINKELGQSGFGFPLALIDNAFCAEECFSPRIVLVEPCASRDPGSSEKRLVKGMFYVQKGAPDSSGDHLRDGISKFDLDNLLSSFWIELSNVGEGVILYVSGEGTLRRGNARLCPIDMLLRSIETHG